MDIVNKIKELKKKHNAIILAHTYQRAEVQDIADFVGDSLELSLRARDNSADLIVFCGVRFMAETAKIISPNKKVLLTEVAAGCPMAEMISADELRELKAKYPTYKVVTYVNSTAEVKALSDICCTSSNAVRVVSSIPQEQGVIFVPDTNLGSYVQRTLKRDNMVVWQGHCYVHSQIMEEDVLALKKLHPNAIVLAHPECSEHVLKHANHVLSTSGMIKKVEEIKAEEFIVITEQGILHPLNKKYPNKKFYSIDRALCLNMKKTTVESVLNSLELMRYSIEVPRDVMESAKRAVFNMLELK
ncbi:MAG TPA: quinolinate synthase NadA [bacterium]|nr:quinolinate synthase NadA [bacterium]